MLDVTHLLDDFSMGGVTRALTMFENPKLKGIARSKVLPMRANLLLAPEMAADVIVDHTPFSVRRMPFLASLRLRNPKAMIVHVEHSYTRAFEEAQVRSKARFRAMLRLGSLFCDRFICVSHAQERWLADTVGIAKDKLETIYPWSGRFELLSLPLSKERAGRPLKLLAYGRYAEVKNFENLIAAMCLCGPSAASLTIFGDGPNAHHLKNMAAEVPNVEVLGPTDNPGPYLADCDAVIIPSRYEAFGLVATEARLAGRAILVSDVDGLPEQVGNAGFVARMSTSQDIVAAIRRARRAPLAAMGRAGRDDVSGQHREILRGWLDLLAQACANRSVPV